MPKFHINGKGEPGPCRATTQCPFGGAEDHFPTAEAARSYFENNMGGSFGAPELERQTPSKTRRRSKKMVEELLETLDGEGFSRLRDLSDEHYAILDPNLTRINENRLTVDDPDLLEGERHLRPYTRLYTYSPHMEGNKGRWVRQTLALDHETGNIYGSTEVTAPGSGFNTVEVAKVVNYGTDFDAAVAGAQNEFDKTFETMRTKDPVVKKARLAVPKEYHAWDNQEYSYEDDILNKKKDFIRSKLTRAVLDAQEWNKELRRRRDDTADKEFLKSAGY